MRHKRQRSNHPVLCRLTGLVLMAAGIPPTWAADVEIWDNGASTWTDTFGDADAIDTAPARYAAKPQVVVDSQGRVYVGFYQSDGSQTRVYLARYDGTDVRVWDNDTSAWTATFADGDPIDNGTANDARNPELAVDSQDRVYVAYYQHDGTNWRIHLSRYDGTDVKIWDNGASAWTDTFGDGDPIDAGAGNHADLQQIVVDSQDRVYLTFRQEVGVKWRIFLVRYDGTDVKIWDNGASAWTDTFTDGDPIDNGTANTAMYPRLATDSQDRVYVTYYQNDGSKNRIYLSRYDGTDVKIWDNGASAWTDTFTDGDPIDNGTANTATYPRLATDSQDRVYVTYYQSDGSKNRIYVSRYDGTDVEIWDNNTLGWTDTFTDGDPIDIGGANSAYSPRLVVDSQDRVYVPFMQSDGAQSHIYLSRYDGTDVRIWDNGASAWTTTFADGDPIDTGTANSTGKLVANLDLHDRVYVALTQTDGSDDRLYLSRYDGTDVKIWDNGASAWTDTFVDGDPIDADTSGNVDDPQIAMDAHGRAYVTFHQTVGAVEHVYLARLNVTAPQSLTTTAASSITATTASSGGNITDDGGVNVTAHGVCWNTTGTPTTADSKTTDGTGAGSFTSNLTGLSANTTYYARAYATNSVGTTYGNQVSFTTDATPTVTTTAASNITSTTVDTGGNVTSDGGDAVTARGVCWNTTGSPTIAHNKTADGTGAGSFSSSLVGLSANTTYHVRAYAANSVGTSYGNEVSFTTDTTPSVTTTAVSNVASTTAVSGGNVTSDGGDAVTARGVCWNTTGSPTIADRKTTDGTGAGSFTSSLTGLSADTTYHVRAYAANSVGTTYGSVVSFTTLSDSTGATSEPDLRIRVEPKEEATTVTVNEEIEFIVYVENAGDADATSVVVTIPIPDNCEFVSAGLNTASPSSSAQTTGPTVTEGDGFVQLEFAGVSAKEVLEVQVVLKVLAAGDVALSATAVSDEISTPTSGQTTQPIVAEDDQTGIVPVGTACGTCGAGAAAAMSCCLPLLMLVRLSRRRSRRPGGR